MKKFCKVFTVLIFIFLYLPMIVLGIASFNIGTDVATWEGFTLGQYKALFQDHTLLPLLGNSFLIAIVAALIATILGTMAAVGIHSMRRRPKALAMTLTNIPMTNPDIVTGVSLALLFAFVGTVLKKNHVMGFTTLLIAHITFDMPYVILSVMPKLSQMDPDLQEAHAHRQHYQHGQQLLPFFARRGNAVGDRIANHQTDQAGNGGKPNGTEKNGEIGPHMGKVIQSESSGNGAGKGVIDHDAQGNQGEEDHPHQIGTRQELILHRLRPPDPPPFRRIRHCRSCSRRTARSSCSFS